MILVQDIIFTTEGKGRRERKFFYGERTAEFFWAIIKDLLTGDKVMDALDRLRKMVNETGEINSVYGGFEIKVLKPTVFPWYKVLGFLLEIGQEVWVKKAEGEIQITSEPKIP